MTAGIGLPRYESGDQARVKDRTMLKVSKGNSAFPWLLCLVLLFDAEPAEANGARPDALRDVGFEQRLNAQVPLDIGFYDENGRSINLGDYFGEKPAILLMMYYDCPTLCPLVLDGLVRSLKALPFDVGKEFNVLTVSIDPREGPEAARKKKNESLERYGRSGAEKGWHFLTGEKDSVDRLTQAVGFRYTYDAETDQYAHAAGIVLLTPQGRVSRYFYDIEFAPRDLRLGLVEASANKIGSPVDQLLLFCYQYDPATGKYSLVVMNALRLAGLGTVLIIATFMFVMFRREKAIRLRTEKER